jgi:polyhydroxyalkanoate synthesis regulator phasin
MADTASAQLFELWRRQFEEAAQSWTRMAGQAPPPPPTDPMAFWRPVLNQGLETWARLFAQTPATPDLAAQWKQFLDQWIDAWSRALSHAMNTEQFAQMMGASLDQWLVAQGPAKKAMEQSVDGALQTLNLASRSQLTSVARQIVELEERVERVEDGVAAVLRRLDDLAQLVASRERPADRMTTERA